MTTVRFHAAVDQSLLDQARLVLSGYDDEAILDRALRAVIETTPTDSVDDQYESYGRHPIDEPDAWGDLESFANAAKRS